jgi:uncharacterized membrane protein YhiD involved in acid resistance
MNPSSVLKIDLTPGHMILSLALAFALAFLWATVYRKTHTGVAYSRSFYLTLILISPIVAMIMMAIGSNVALSLGLVGSLSIIRFRTAIKDPRDMAFLLFGIGMGLCAGANAWLLAMIGTALVSAITMVLPRVGRASVGNSDYILVFRSSAKEPWEQLPAAAQQLVSWKQLRGATDADHGSEFEYTYNVRLAAKAAPETVVHELSSSGKIRQVTLISPENHLDL